MDGANRPGSKVPQGVLDRFWLLSMQCGMTAAYDCIKAFVVVFGNPKAGTPMMAASPSIALELPLKILVSEDAAGVTWMSYVAPDCLASRHDIPLSLIGPLQSVEALVDAVATEPLRFEKAAAMITQPLTKVRLHDNSD